jgi:hypothetical protein
MISTLERFSSSRSLFRQLIMGNEGSTAVTALARWARGTVRIPGPDPMSSTDQEGSRLSFSALFLPSIQIFSESS